MATYWFCLGMLCFQRAWPWLHVLSPMAWSMHPPLQQGGTPFHPTREKENIMDCLIDSPSFHRSPPILFGHQLCGVTLPAETWTNIYSLQISIHYQQTKEMIEPTAGLLSLWAHRAYRTMDDSNIAASLEFPAQLSACGWVHSPHQLLLFIKPWGEAMWSLLSFRAWLHRVCLLL